MEKTVTKPNLHCKCIVEYIVPILNSKKKKIVKFQSN